MLQHVLDCFFFVDEKNKKKDKKNNKTSPNGIQNDKLKNKTKTKKKSGGFISKGIFVLYFIYYVIC